MAKDLPFYHMYPKDFDSDENVRGLDLTEAGLFLFCLNHAWNNDGLPSDPVEIARNLKVPVKIFTKLWKRVGCCFSLNEAGRFVNARQEDERERAITKSRRATDSIRRRWEKPQTRTDSEDTDGIRSYDKRMANVPIRASDSDSGYGICSEKLNPEVKSSTRAEDFIGMWIRAGFDSPEGFESWYQILYAEHPTRGEFEIGKRLIVQEIISGSIRRSDFEEGYAAHRNSPQWKRDKGRYIPKLSIFCRDRGWKFPPVAGNGNAADGKEHY